MCVLYIYVTQRIFTFNRLKGKSVLLPNYLPHSFVRDLLGSFLSFHKWGHWGTKWFRSLCPGSSKDRHRQKNGTLRSEFIRSPQIKMYNFSWRPLALCRPNQRFFCFVLFFAYWGGLVPTYSARIWSFVPPGSFWHDNEVFQQ